MVSRKFYASEKRWKLQNVINMCYKRLTVELMWIQSVAGQFDYYNSQQDAGSLFSGSLMDILGEKANMTYIYWRFYALWKKLEKNVLNLRPK